MILLSVVLLLNTNKDIRFKNNKYQQNTKTMLNYC